MYLFQRTSSNALKARYGSKAKLNASRISLNNSRPQLGASTFLPSGGASPGPGGDIEMQKMKSKEDKQPLITKDNKVAPVGGDPKEVDLIQVSQEICMLTLPPV